MLTGYSTNESGTTIAVGVCDTCGKDYTVCPPPKVWADWADCLTPECDSYDIERDADLWFEPMADHGLVHREET